MIISHELGHERVQVTGVYPGREFNLVKLRSKTRLIEGTKA